MNRIAMLSLVVREYDEAISYFTSALGFRVVEDTPRGDGKRWVVLAPEGGDSGARLLLARAATPEQLEAVGNQTGGRVFLFLETDDFWRDYKRMQEHHVDFVEEPRHEAYGWVVVFRDLYGNKWDFIERRDPSIHPA